MIHPSYTELIQAINNNAEEDDNTMMLNSRYSLVLATSKRARQLIAGAEPLVPGAAGKKPLSVAIDELYKGEVKIVAAADTDDEETAQPTAEEPTESNCNELGICGISGSCMRGDIVLFCEISSLQIRNYCKDEYSCNS